MESSILDAGILDIVWFLVKVLIAIFIIAIVFSLIGAFFETSIGAGITLGVIFIAVLAGIYFLIAWIATMVSGGKGYIFANWVFGIIFTLGALGWLLGDNDEKKTVVPKRASIEEEEVWAEFLNYSFSGEKNFHTLTELLDFRHGKFIVEDATLRIVRF